METKKILVIDDEARFGEVLKGHLENPSPMGIFTSSVASALNEVDRQIPDLVVLDLLTQNGANAVQLEESLLSDPRLAGKCVVTVSPVSRKVMYRAPKGLPVHVVITPRRANGSPSAMSAKGEPAGQGLLGTIKRLIGTGVQA